MMLSAPSMKAEGRLCVWNGVTADQLLTSLIAKASPADAQPGIARHIRPQYRNTPLNLRSQFKENQDAWLQVDKILQEAKYPQTKCKRSKPLFGKHNG